MSTLVEQSANRGKPLSILLVDIDHFKRVNDTHGHDVGDAVIREFARRMANNVRSVDLACRYGGEEFVVIMPETDKSLAHSVAERLRARIAEEPFTPGGVDAPLTITASIGVAGLDTPYDTPLDLLRSADAALYRAKRDGRNRVVANAA